MNTRICLKNFERTRTRCRRDSDGTVFAGWIAYAESQSVDVQMTPQTPILANDEFTIEAYGSDARAIFRAVASSARRGDLPNELVIRMSVLGAIKFIDAIQEGRVLVRGLSVSFVEGNNVHIGEVHDLSEHGMGATISSKIAPDTRVQINVQVNGEIVHGTGLVRYCRPEGDQFRVGMLIQGLGRIEQARWNLMIDEQRAA